MTDRAAHCTRGSSNLVWSKREKSEAYCLPTCLPDLQFWTIIINVLKKQAS